MNKSVRYKSLLWVLCAAFLSLFLVHCSGGGSSSVIPSTTTNPNTKKNSMNWSTPGPINSGSGTVSALFPQVAFNQSSGNAIAIWSEVSPTAGTELSAVHAAEFSAGSGWGADTIISPVNLAAPSSILAGDPHIAFDKNGNGLVVYELDVTVSDAYGIVISHDYAIYATPYTPGSGWGTPTVVSSPSSSSEPYEPRVSFDRNGNATVAWTWYDGTYYRVFANRYTAGSGWGTQTALDNDTGDAGGLEGPGPELVADPNTGNVIVVWRQYNGTHNIINANIYTVGSGWGTATPLSTSAGDADQVQIGIDPNGNAIAVWAQYNTTGLYIDAINYTPGSGWGTPNNLDSGTTNIPLYPQIAFDPNGNAMAVWMEGANNGIYVRSYSPTGGWGTSNLLMQSVTIIPGQPQIGFDGSGNAIVVWEGDDSNGTVNIYSDKYTPASGWVSPSIVYTENSAGGLEPVVAVDQQSGHALAVWQKSVGPPYVDIDASLY